MIRDLTKLPKLRSEAYLEWVRSLPCCGCGIVGRNHAHHSIAYRHGSSKHSDLAAMSLCPACHACLHAGWPDWEAEYGAQWLHIFQTLDRAASMGVLVVDARAARELS